MGNVDGADDVVGVESPDLCVPAAKEFDAEMSLTESVKSKTYKEV